MHEDLERLCELLKKELHKTVDKFEKSGDMSGGAIDYLDKISHALKSVKTIMAMEGSDYSGYSRRDDYSGRYSRRYSNGYANGYSGDYSGASEEIREIKEMIDRIPDDKLRREMERSLARAANM